MPNMNIQFFFIFTGAHTCTCTIIALSLYSSGISILINDLASIKNSAFYNTDPVISTFIEATVSLSPRDLYVTVWPLPARQTYFGSVGPTSIVSIASKVLRHTVYTAVLPIVVLVTVGRQTKIQPASTDVIIDLYNLIILIYIYLLFILHTLNHNQRYCE